MATTQTTGAGKGSWLKENWLLLLLVFVPIALLMEHVLHSSPLWIFIAASAAIIPLAAVMGHATEALAERMGEGVGGLLNATFGNAAELIIAIVALRAGYIELVKASITGSIIGNLLLVFGLSCLWGGFKFERQVFNRTAAGLSATLLVLSAVALVIPSVFHMVVPPTSAAAERTLSVEISVVLIVTYALSLWFSLRTHKHLYVGGHGHGMEDVAPAPVSAAAGTAPAHVAAPATGHAAGTPGGPSTGKAVGQLLAATAGVALMSEMLVKAVEHTAQVWGMNQVFVGVILVALIGNAAEHSSAILMAAKNKMDTAITIAVGSSIQIALFVAPVLVFLSYVVAPQPMDLRFTTLEVVAVGISVWIMSLIAQDGESHWMEGVQLLAVYLILGLAFYWLPMTPTPAGAAPH